MKAGFGPKKPGDAGIDLRAAERTEVGVRQTAVIPLGVAIEIPDETVGWLTGRSSSTLAFSVMCHEGKIDSAYRGEIHAIVTALERGVTINRGERIAQLVIVRIASPIAQPTIEVQDFGGWIIADDLHATERGEMGLGSTGRN